MYIYIYANFHQRQQCAHYNTNSKHNGKIFEEQLSFMASLHAIWNGSLYVEVYFVYVIVDHHNEGGVP